MKIEYLKEFITLAQYKSYSQAADELFITQSCLSKHILQLEKELGVQLFDRSQRHVEISKIGEEVLNYAVQICNLNNNLEAAISTYKQDKAHYLTVASIPVMAQYHITKAITRFKIKYPYINVSIQAQEGSTINHSLKTHEADLGFQRVLESPHADLDYLPFCTDRLAVILPTDHPLSSLEAIQLEQLSDENFMLLDKNTMLYNLSYNACLAAGFKPLVTYTGNRPENLMELVRSGMGVALLMKRQADYYNPEGISIIPVIPVIENTIFLTKLKGYKLSEAAKIFWDFISEDHDY